MPPSASGSECRFSGRGPAGKPVVHSSVFHLIPEERLATRGISILYRSFSASSIALACRQKELLQLVQLLFFLDSSVRFDRFFLLNLFFKNFLDYVQRHLLETWFFGHSKRSFTSPTLTGWKSYGSDLLDNELSFSRG